MRSALPSSFLFLLLVACGGSNQEAKAPTPPTTDSADVPRDGSPTPGADVIPDPPKKTTEPIKTSAVSNTADGSDIVPPFTAGKDDKKADAPAKPKKKGGKPKKKT